MHVLDQRQLPLEMKYVPIANAAAAHDAISSMLVRGAPAIAICAALAVAVEVQSHAAGSGFATGTAAARRVTPGPLLCAAPLTTPYPTQLRGGEARLPGDQPAHRGELG